MMRVGHVLALCTVVVSTSGAAIAQEIDWKKVDEAIGRSAAVVSGDVHRYGFPRSDLHVTLDGVTIRPALALGGWTAFKPMHGDPVKLATAIRTGLAASKIPLTPPSPPATQPTIDLDTGQLDQIIGVKGQANGGVYQFGVPRRDPISETGTQMTPAGPLGLATGIGFQPTGGGKAAITGDFVLAAEEVNPVIQTLRSNGIEVTALHSHMLDEQPRLFFMHFWANDDALKLARALRAALDKTASAKS